jgi:hypothetical protein
VQEASANNCGIYNGSRIHRLQPHAVKEGLWLRKLLGDLSMHIDTVAVFADNQSAIKLLRDPISSTRGASTLM